MANVTYVKISDLQTAYRRSTTKLYRAYTKKVPEYSWMQDIPDEDIIPSGRQNLIPLDVTRGYGAHQADDGGYESQTATPALQEGVFTFNHTNSRFAISLRAQALDKAGRGNFIIRQIKFQSIKAIEAVMRKYAYMFYGFSTGVVAQCNGSQGSAGSHTITLMNAFGNTFLNNAAYLAAMFTVGEGVGLVQGGALVTNAIGTVTAVTPATPSITVTWIPGNVTITSGNNIVYANGVTGNSLSETDFNKWNVGLFDIHITDTIHSLSQAAFPAWGPAIFDQTGGSFGFLKAKKLRQALENNGDTVLKRIVYANGVENDMQARERAAVLWTDSYNMNIDANVKAKGVTFDTTRFTPNGCAFGIGADAYGKKVLTDYPDEEETIDFGKLFKAEDRSALKGGVDIISANICHSRARFGAFTGLNEQ